VSRRGTVSVYVDVDVDGIIEDISDEDLIAELKSRKVTIPQERAIIDLAEEALTWLRCGNAAEAQLVLERTLFPEWSTPMACLESIAKAKEAGA
jgi:hypothetical protein